MEVSAKPLLGAACAAVLAGCSPAPADSIYTSSGELLALSGGNAGPQAACHICHGLKGEGDGDLAPRLAGLERGYLARQLNFYAEGFRPHAQMHWIAKKLSPSEQDSVAEYYANMEWAPMTRRPDNGCDARSAALYHQGDETRGLASCASCHGEAGEGVGKGNPALAGQSARYNAAQLVKWRQGERYGDPLGEMRNAARLLTEEEIEPLAIYISSLSGSLDGPESQAACPPPLRPDQ